MSLLLSLLLFLLLLSSSSSSSSCGGVCCCVVLLLFFSFSFIFFFFFFFFFFSIIIIYHLIFLWNIVRSGGLATLGKKQTTSVVGVVPESQFKSPLGLKALVRTHLYLAEQMVSNAYSNPKQRRSPLPRIAIFVFVTVCIWSLYTAKYSAKLRAIKVPTPDLGAQSLKIFTYKLPKRFNVELLANIKNDKKRYAGYQDQLAEATIYAELLTSSVHTKDPKEADLFFVPVFAAASVSQLVHKPQQRERARKLVLEAQSYIEKHYPYWSRYNGADHVWVFTHDHGPCFDTTHERAFESKTMRLLAEKLKDSIFLTNTGDLMSPCFNPKQSIVIPPFLGKDSLSNFFHREPFQTRDIFASFRGQTTLIKPKDPWFRYLMLYGAKNDKVHNHGKKPVIEPCFDWATNANSCATCQGACCAAEIADDRVYSNGVRQRLLTMFRNKKSFDKTGIFVSSKKSKNWMDEMKQSTFCLAPLGFAKWSIRCFESIAAGCIPVIIANNLTMPFEHYVDWRAFSVTIKETDISKIPFALKNISASKLREMQENLDKVKLHFSYGSVDGIGDGQAFALIVDELSRKFKERQSFFESYSAHKNAGQARVEVSSVKAPWRKWVPLGKRRVKAVPYPPSFDPEIVAGPESICLATQLSSDRADLLARILYRWEGPVSAAVLIKKDDETTDEKIEQIFAETFSDRTEADADERLSFSYLRYSGSHPSGKFQHYPVNVLRNMALRKCNTKYVMILDVDFLPSSNAYKNIQNHLHILDDQGRNALVVPAFEVDADVLNRDSSAIDNVRYKSTLRKLYMFDKRLRWRDTPRTRSKARAFQLMHYKDGHHPTKTETWMHSSSPYAVDYKWGYEPYVVLKHPFPLFEESFVGYGQNKVSYAYHLAAARFSFIVVPDVFVIHVHTDKSIGVKVVSNSAKFKLNQKAIDIIKISKDFTVGWSCWRPFIDKIDRMYGFRAVEPCWVSQYVWNDVNNKRGEQCVINI